MPRETTKLTRPLTYLGEIQEAHCKPVVGPDGRLVLELMLQGPDGDVCALAGPAVAAGLYAVLSPTYQTNARAMRPLVPASASPTTAIQDAPVIAEGKLTVAPAAPPLAAALLVLGHSDSRPAPALQISLVSAGHQDVAGRDGTNLRDTPAQVSVGFTGYHGNPIAVGGGGGSGLAAAVMVGGGGGSASTAPATGTGGRLQSIQDGFAYFVSCPRYLTEQEFTDYYVPQLQRALGSGAAPHFLLARTNDGEEKVLRWLLGRQARITVYTMSTPSNDPCAYHKRSGFSDATAMDVALTRDSHLDIAWVPPGLPMRGARVVANLQRRTRRQHHHVALACAVYLASPTTLDQVMTGDAGIPVTLADALRQRLVTPEEVGAAVADRVRDLQSQRTADAVTKPDGAAG